MKKIKIAFICFIFIQNAFAAADLNTKINNCSKNSFELNNFENELNAKRKLLNQQKDEMEKLPVDAINVRMKLTSEMFVTAAEVETIQNKIELSKKIKFKNCQKHK